MKKLILAIILLCCSMPILAVTVTSEKTKIASVYSTKDALLFTTETYTHTSSTCNGRRFKLNSQHTDYATQAASFSTSKQVILIFEGNQKDCAPIVDRFWVFN